MVASGVIDDNVFEKYITAVYWAIVTCATVGYGDIVPQNMFEKMMCICTLIFGVAFFSYLLSALANIFATLQRRSVLLHHPYDSFAPVINMLKQAARDPNVLAISTTLNGVRVQGSNTSDMIFDVPAIIEYLSGSTTLVPGTVDRFPDSPLFSVPHIGWNGVTPHQACPALDGVAASAKVYFVHSFAAAATPANAHWVAATTDYGGQRFISAVQRGNVYGAQFHPEKSHGWGIQLLKNFAGL